MFATSTPSHHLSDGATEVMQGMILDWKADSGEAGQLVHVLGIKKQELAVWQKRRDYDQIEKKNIFSKFSFIVSQHMAVHHGAFDVGGDCIRLLVVNQFTVNLVFLSLVKNMIQHSSHC